MSGLSKKGRERLERYRESNIGKVGRSALRSTAAIPGNIADVPLLAYNLPAMLMGKKTYSVGEKSKELMDRALGMEGRPIDPSMRLGEAALDVMLPGGVATKVINAGEKASKISKIAHSMYAPTKSAVAGSVAAQHVSNVDPTNPLGAFAAGIGIPLVSGKIGTSLKNRSTNKAIKHAQKNPNLRKEAIEYLGHEAGAPEIKGMTREESGKVITRGQQHQKKADETLFNERFSKAETEARKITDNFKNYKTHLKIGPTIKSFLDDVNWEHLSAAERKIILETEPGKAVKRLLGFNNSKKSVSQIDDIYKNKEFPELISKYHNVNNISRDLRNFTSKGDVIGSVEQGLAKKLNSGLIDDMGTVFKDDPKMHQYWKDTRNMYSVEMEHHKPLKNKVLEHQPREFFKGKPTEAFLETTTGKGNVLESPHNLDYYLKGLNPEDKNKYIQGLLNEIGSKSGEFSLPEAVGGFKKLKEPIRNILTGGMEEGTRNKFGRGQKLISAHEYEMAQPLKSWKMSKRNIPDIINPYAKTDPKSIERYIRALENRAGVESSLKPVRTAENILGSTREGLNQSGTAMRTAVKERHDPMEELSDEELMRIVEAPSSPEPDLNSLSDEELMSIANS